MTRQISNEHATIKTRTDAKTFNTWQNIKKKLRYIENIHDTKQKKREKKRKWMRI